jgi:colicin import membrane protein
MDEMAFFDPRPPRTDFWMGFGGSLAVHSGIVVAVLVMSMLAPGKPTSVPFYQVKLISSAEFALDQGKASKPAAKPAKRSTPARLGASRSIPVMPVKRLHYSDETHSKVNITKSESAAGVPAVQTPAPEIEKNLEQLLPKPSEASPPKPATTQREASDEEMKALDELTNPAQLPTVSANQPSAERSGSQEDEEIGLAQRLYYTEVWNAIRRQWALPNMLRSSRLEAVIIVVIRRDGKILKTSFERRSGNDAYDESALRAVKKADPLPAFPEIYSPRQVEIGVRFRPEELQ